MNYRETLEFLNSRGNEVQGIHLGLHRTLAVMRALGNPHLDYPVLHIAGTNGKGSVAAMSESILRHAGFRTGLYTSPHLVRVEERIQVDARPIAPARLADRMTKIRKTEASLLRRNRLDRPLTYFELVTCCAFLHFSEENLDIAVVEVGLGGRLDATNIVQPDVCVITGISHDHGSLLGSTLAAIAGEKAGILKSGVTAVTACRAPSALRVIRAAARRAGTPLIEIDRDCRLTVHRLRNGRSVIRLRTLRRDYTGLRLSLAGAYQARNAALAVCAVEALRSLAVRASDIRRGLANTRWPGRLDVYHARRRTLLEGAHNPEGARALQDFLLKGHEAEIHLVFGALRDKDIRQIGALLFPLARSIHLARLANSRGAEPERIAALFPQFASKTRTWQSSRRALRAAWDECPRKGLVVVTGSLYLLGEVLPLVKKTGRAFQFRAAKGREFISY